MTNAEKSRISFRAAAGGRWKPVIRLDEGEVEGPPQSTHGLAVRWCLSPEAEELIKAVKEKVAR